MMEHGEYLLDFFLPTPNLRDGTEFRVLWAGTLQHSPAPLTLAFLTAPRVMLQRAACSGLAHEAGELWNKLWYCLVRREGDSAPDAHDRHSAFH